MALTATADVIIDRSSEIVVREDAPSATRLAADELNFFLRKSLGASLPIVSSQTHGKTAIILGGDAPPSLGRDGYVIEAVSNVLRIVGHDDAIVTHALAAAPWQPCFRRGTLFGVYAFLERFAGVRMYFPGELGTCIPKTESLTIPEIRIEESPTFSVRRYGYADGTIPEDMLDGGNDSDFKRLNWLRLRMETDRLECCHGAQTHCLSPQTWDVLYTIACVFFESGNSPVFDAMPKDGLTWANHCRCNWCIKNVPYSRSDIGFATDLVWQRTAELAEKLRAKFPAARVSQMSYTPYAKIPTNEIPDNVDVFVARRGPWAEGTEIGEREKDDVLRWHEKLGRKVTLWNYPDKVACWNLEMADIPQIAPRAWASYYRAVAPHITGAFAESESDRWLYNYLNYYVFSRLCWNPAADVEEILAEHHRLMFGAAAPEMAEFFNALERCWMMVVATPYDTPRGPGVCEAPTEDELRANIYTPALLDHLKSLLDSAEAKVERNSLEARRIALFRREYFAPLENRIRSILRIGLISDIHIGDNNDASDLRLALRLFDEKKADAILAAGDLTDFGLLSELREVADAWNDTFPGNKRSDGAPIVRLFHYGDHDTALNFKVREREVVAKGRWLDYIPRICPDVAWQRAFGEPFEPVIRRTVKGCEFTLVHFLPNDLKAKFNQTIPPPGLAPLHIFSQHKMYRGLLARPGHGDEVSWDDGASLELLRQCPNLIAVCGHGHISATNETSFYRSDDFSAIEIPSLFYQIETWLPKAKGDHSSHQALFMTVAPDGITIERLDIRTGAKLAPDWSIKFTKPTKFQ